MKAWLPLPRPPWKPFTISSDSEHTNSWTIVFFRNIEPMFMCECEIRNSWDIIVVIKLCTSNYSRDILFYVNRIVIWLFWLDSDLLNILDLTVAFQLQNDVTILSSELNISITSEFDKIVPPKKKEFDKIVLRNAMWYKIGFLLFV